MTSTRPLIIFDIDGTLVDPYSNPLKWRPKTERLFSTIAELDYDCAIGQLFYSLV